MSYAISSCDTVGKSMEINSERGEGLFIQMQEHWTIIYKWRNKEKLAKP